MLASILIAVTSAALVSAHSVLTYPGWRGDNLITNATFPYGMQWMYPCKSISVPGLSMAVVGALDDFYGQQM